MCVHHLFAGAQNPEEGVGCPQTVTVSAVTVTASTLNCNATAAGQGGLIQSAVSCPHSSRRCSEREHRYRFHSMADTHDELPFLLHLVHELHGNNAAVEGFTEHLRCSIQGTPKPVSLREKQTHTAELRVMVFPALQTIPGCPEQHLARGFYPGLLGTCCI